VRRTESVGYTNDKRNGFAYEAEGISPKILDKRSLTMPQGNKQLPVIEITFCRRTMMVPATGEEG